MTKVPLKTLPDGIEGVAYSKSFSASGGGGVYAWALVSGALPPGLHIGENGSISGLPTAPGTSHFTVGVTSRDGRSAQLALSMTVNAPLAVTTRAVPDCVAKVAYGRSLVASGGAGGYTWALAADSGPLPEGLELATNGDITGSPTGPGTSRFTVEVTSGDGQTAQRTLTITVKAASVVRPARTLGPAVRRAGSVLLSVGFAAAVWLPLVQLFPSDGLATWYESVTADRPSVYDALYPVFHLIFLRLCPILLLAAGVYRMSLWLATRGSLPARATPSTIRAVARASAGKPLYVRSQRARLRGALALQLGAISALHLVGLALFGTNDSTGLTLGLVVCLLAIRAWSTESGWELSLLGLLGTAQAATFVQVLNEAPVPFANRPMLVVTASLYLAVPVIMAGMLLPKPRARAVVALAISLIVGALLVEAGGTWVLSRRGDDQAPDPGRPESVAVHRGPQEQHPEMGPIPVPGTVTETLYPDDPRGYFRLRSPAWELGNQPSSEARLESTNDGIAVLIDRADDPAPWHIAVARPGVALEAGREYTIQFRVRASRERGFRFTVSMAHPPGESLGVSDTGTATTEWRSIDRTFTAPVSDDDGQVDLSLGGDTADIYVSDMSVRRADDGTRVDGVAHYVAYDWNSRGCRAPEYSIPPGPETFRVLALGGSYAMGQGVHAADVFTSVMERLLRERANQTSDARQFEVVDCGVSGFSIREERLLYEEQASAYQPDLVLVVMVANDARPITDDERLASVHVPVKWEFLLRTGYLVQSIRHAPPEPDFSSSMEELTALHDRVRSDGAELALVLFTNGVGPAWDRLSASARATAQALGVPILDLGETLLSDDAPAELTVHPGDDHPNEVAHRIAAERIAEWLEREGLTQPSS